MLNIIGKIVFSERFLKKILIYGVNIQMMNYNSLAYRYVLFRKEYGMLEK